MNVSHVLHQFSLFYLYLLFFVHHAPFYVHNLSFMWCPRNTHREASAAFWRIFYHDGKISPAWWGWGVYAHPLSLYLPSRTKLQCTLNLTGQMQIHSLCFIPTPLYSVAVSTTEYIFLLEMKQGSVSAHSAGAYTATLLVMVKVVKGGGRAPPTLTSLG